MGDGRERENDFARVFAYSATLLLLIVLFADETWYPRGADIQLNRPTGIYGRILNLTGVTAFRERQYKAKVWHSCMRLVEVFFKPVILISFFVYMLSMFLCFPSAIFPYSYSRLVVRFHVGCRHQCYLIYHLRYSSTRWIRLLSQDHLIPLLHSSRRPHYRRSFRSLRERQGRCFLHSSTQWSLPPRVPTLRLLPRRDSHDCGSQHCRLSSRTHSLRCGDYRWMGILCCWSYDCIGCHHCLASFLLSSLRPELVLILSVYSALDCYPSASGEVSAAINLGRTTGGFAVGYFQLEWGMASGFDVSFGSE